MLKEIIIKISLIQQVPKFHRPKSKLSTTAAAPTGKKRREKRTREGRRARASSSHSASQSVRSATNSTIAFGDASAQPAYKLHGSAGGEERGRAAEVQSRKDRKSEAAAATAEKKERVSGGGGGGPNALTSSQS